MPNPAGPVAAHPRPDRMRPKIIKYIDCAFAQIRNDVTKSVIPAHQHRARPYRSANFPRVGPNMAEQKFGANATHAAVSIEHPNSVARVGMVSVMTPPFSAPRKFPSRQINHRAGTHPRSPIGVYSNQAATSVCIDTRSREPL